jgi:hypothetical protein
LTHLVDDPVFDRHGLLLRVLLFVQATWSLSFFEDWNTVSV